MRTITLSQSTPDGAAAPSYTVLVDGAPAMASTPDRARALAVLQVEIGRATRNAGALGAFEVNTWDGDTGTGAPYVYRAGAEAR